MATRKGCFFTFVQWIRQFLVWIFCYCCRPRKSANLRHGYRPVKIVSLGGYRSRFFFPTRVEDDEAAFLVRTFSTRSTRSAPTSTTADIEKGLPHYVDFILVSFDAKPPFTHVRHARINPIALFPPIKLLRPKHKQHRTKSILSTTSEQLR